VRRAFNDAQIIQRSPDACDASGNGGGVILGLAPGQESTGLLLETDIVPELGKVRSEHRGDDS